VSAAGTTNVVPMCGCNSTSSFDIVGAPRFEPGQRPDVGWRVVSPGYFAALRIPLRAGRAFTAADNAQNAPVVIVTEAVSRRWFPDGGALGRMILVEGDTTRPAQVVGIVGDVRHAGPVQPVDAEIYLPQSQRPENGITIVARTSGDPATLLPVLRRVVLELDRDQPVFDQRTMRDVMNLAIGPYRFSMRLLAGLGIVALLLAGVGIYGVIAHLVTERTREIGVRIALGGDEGTVRRLVVRQGMAPALAGLAVGVVLALGLGQLLAKAMVGVSPRDPATFVAVAAILMFVALAACWVPARRASRVDPMIALRND
jgi:predicted permease